MDDIRFSEYKDIKNIFTWFYLVVIPAVIFKIFFFFLPEASPATSGGNLNERTLK